MSYADIDDVKQVLGRSTLTAEQEARVSFFLGVTQDLLDSIIGDLTYGVKTEQVNVCNLREYVNSPTELLFNTRNITAIHEINSTSYTGVLGTDFIILPPNQRKVQFTDISTYISGLIFDWCDFKYVSGFSTIPEDLKRLQAQMVAGEYAKENGQEIQSYTLGDKSVTYAGKNTDTNYNMFKQVLGKYKAFRL